MSDTEDSRPLSGLRALVVEDEIMVAMLIEQMLYDLGVENVRSAPNISEALALIAEAAPDFAALDVNLRGTQVFPVAAELAARKVAFLFVTGYGAHGVDAAWADRPVLQKPFSIDALEACVAKALGR